MPAALAVYRLHRHVRRLIAASCAAVCCAVQAEQVWLRPQPYSPAAGAPVEVGLQSGEHFRGAPRSLAADTTAALQLYSKAAVRNLREQLAPEQDTGSLRITPSAAGTHMVVYDSEPELTQHASGEFSKWLRAQELRAVLAQRKQEQADESPVRERVRRHAKTLLRVGGRSDGTYGLLTGQRLEIVPTADPLARKRGDTLTFTILFNSKPLAGVLVEAWHRSEGQAVNIRVQTGGDGKAAFILPWAGEWLIATAHLISAADNEDADWEGFRASLSFELPAAGDAR